MTKYIILALLGCTIISAIGGFAGAMICSSYDKECSSRWQTASSGSLAAAASLGTLLAKIGSNDPQP